MTMTGEALKKQAALKALERVRPGMRLGLGTGSTARHFVDALAARLREERLDLLCVPTSRATEAQARALGIPLGDLDAIERLDLTVDGADEFDARLRLIKGGGGALLREKIVAQASDAMIVIADGSKRAERLGRFPLPVEVVPFGFAPTFRAIMDAVAQTQGRAFGKDAFALRRQADGGAFVTDGGHWILDCRLEAITRPGALAQSLVAIPGVVEHGLFLGLASLVICADAQGLLLYEPAANEVAELATD